jgi:hypothetical protein
MMHEIPDVKESEETLRHMIEAMSRMAIRRNKGKDNGGAERPTTGFDE